MKRAVVWADTCLPSTFLWATLKLSVNPDPYANEEWRVKIFFHWKRGGGERLHSDMGREGFCLLRWDFCFVNRYVLFSLYVLLLYFNIMLKFMINGPRKMGQNS